MKKAFFIALVATAAYARLTHPGEPLRAISGQPAAGSFSWTKAPN